MKKALLLAAAAMSVASANAVAPSSLQLMKSETSLVKELKAPVTNTTEFAPVRSSKAASVAHRAVEEGNYRFMPIRQMPGNMFWLNGLYSLDAEQKPIFKALAVLPPHTPLTFTGATAAFPKEGAPDFDDWDAIKFSWEAYNSLMASSPMITSNEKALTLSYQNDGGYIYTPSLPKMTWSYKTASYTTEDEVYYGIVNSTKEMALGGKIEPFPTQQVFPQTNEIKALTNMPIFSMGDVEYYDNGQTMSELNNQLQKPIFAEDFKAATSEDLDTACVKALGFYLDYHGTPYILNSLKVSAFITASKDGRIHFKVLKGTGEKNEVIFEQDVRVPSTGGVMNDGSSYELAFESEDADGMFVSYIMVDGPLMVEMTSDVDCFAPVSVCYSEDTDAPYSLGFNAFATVELKGQTQTRYARSEGDYYIFGRTETTPGMMPLFFEVEVDMEYPILNPVATAIGDAVDASEYDLVSYNEDGIYTVKLPEGETYAGFLMTTSAETADEIYFNEDDLESFVDVEVGAISRAIVDGMEQVLMPVVVEFSGEADDRYADLKASYLGKEVTLRVVQGDPEIAGIAGVEAEGNGAVQYFDIQGRKLNAAPATGFFIQKQGNKVTKVIR